MSPQPVPPAVAPSPGPPVDMVAHLPPIGTTDRWSWLQRLRRQEHIPLEPWLQALESGHLAPHHDLMSVLADHLDGPAMARLLRWWLWSEPRDPNLPPLIIPRRDPDGLAALREACADSRADPERLVALLPLLGHQRDPLDFPLLQGVSMEPGPLRMRQAALEGICRGLGAWPLSPLRHTLLSLARDLDPAMAGTAVDALARLPEARPTLLALSHQSLDPAVKARLERRLRRLKCSRLVLFAHGRSGGLVPLELVELALELEELRGAPVVLEILTGEPPPLPSSSACQTTTLVPLFLLPGGHVRRDLPVRFRRWRATGPVRILPFLGSWPTWQDCLGEEVRRLPPAREGAMPLLVHHPVEGSLPQRFLNHLATVCGATCLAVPYPVAEEGNKITLPMEPALPLALAASRLTDGFSSWLGSPLLARPQLRMALVQLLVALP